MPVRKWTFDRWQAQGKQIMSQAIESHVPENAPARPNEFNLVWVDMEMTGLEPDTDRIIEVAVVVTDPFI